VRAAFSLVNIVAAACKAVMLCGLISRELGRDLYPWAAPTLLLTGFPQLNWGYHILTDTLGLTTAFAASILVVRAMSLFDSAGWMRRGATLGGLFVVQALAFLTRETALFTVVVALVCGATGLLRRRFGWTAVSAALATVTLAKLPSLGYELVHGVEGITSFPLTPSRLLAPWYVLDLAVKSAVAFHLAWIPVLCFAVRRELNPLPPLVTGWTVAALLYMTAGYVHNDPALVGYPLRLTYALFPLVFMQCARFFKERPFFAHHGGRVAIACAVYGAVSVAGVLLDGHQGSITVRSLFQDS
jgi:hypothetical protein